MSQLKWTCTSEIFPFSVWLNKNYCAKSLYFHTVELARGQVWHLGMHHTILWTVLLHKWNKLTLEVISSEKTEAKIPGLGAPLKTIWSENSKKDDFFQDFLLEKQEIWPGWLKARYNWIAFLKQGLELGVMSAKGERCLLYPSKTSGYDHIVSRICYQQLAYQIHKCWMHRYMTDSKHAELII